MVIDVPIDVPIDVSIDDGTFLSALPPSIPDLIVWVEWSDVLDQESRPSAYN